MGWLDKLKDWAEDAVEEVEETVDDARSWVEETVGSDGGGLIDKVTDLVGEKTDGTWLEDAWNGAKDLVSGDADGGGLIDKVTDLVGEKTDGTWLEDAWNGAKDLVGGDAAAAVPGAVGAATSSMAPAATTTASDLQPADAVGDDLLLGALVKPANPDLMTMSAPPVDAPADAMTMPEPVADPMPEMPELAAEPAMADPVSIEPAPEPTQFDADIAAAEQVESSVDDLFADL